MARLIDADRVIVKWKMALNEMVQDEYGLYPFDFKTVIEWLEAEATEDAEPVVHGEWFCIDPEIELYACSECANRILRRRTKYCANCGARMKKGE